METFAQLIDGIDSEPDVRVMSGVHIVDKPRFPVRGLMIDTARHYLTTGTIQSVIDGMSYNKLNLLHWHMSDNIAFPFDSLKWPKLAKYGAHLYPSHTYTPIDVSMIVEYAKRKGVQVMIEIDSPGHAGGMLKGYPEYAPDCLNPTYGPLDPSNPDTFTFLMKLWTELFEIVPSHLVHIGGDEVDPTCWLQSPRVQQFMKDNNFTTGEQVQSYFERRLIGHMEARSKRSMVWQEVFFRSGDTPPPITTLINVWEPHDDNWKKKLAAVTAQGYSAVLSAPWYLDQISSTQDWIKFYQQEPLDFIGPVAQKNLVIGGEACMWGEYVDGANIIQRVFPRASAVAERLWSDRAVTDIEDATLRLQEFRCKLLTRGIQAESLGPNNYCIEEWDVSKSPIHPGIL
ncbi:hypothetical protein, variant [Sphaeroforma arctica JP610]|nr:hypothetical protein, variant [Sphaeroforma arctica JP610]KNC82225.1 hypothetical protein, variant [Sphaeroforma arctica JP610]|eukprot:XP_014156128.1 hypothetical protein, variant [Sphaeroforma arctica JP610]